jgi:hypothetical protein
LRRVLADRAKQLHQVEVLMALLVHAGGGGLARDGHYRRTVHVRVGHAGDQVGGARPQCGQAHARPAGQAPIDVGHEGRALLVPHGDEADAAIQQRVHDIEVLLAGQPEDVFHSLVFQAADQ